MSETQVSGGTNGETSPGRRSRKGGHRSSPFAKPVYLVMEINDENGQPMKFDRERINVLATDRNAEKVLDITNSKEHPNAFHIVVQLPPAANPRTATAE